MKTPMIILVLIALAVPAFAQQTTADADAEYLNRRYAYTLNRDGSLSMTYSHELKIITPFAFNRAYGESFIVYNPDWQTLKINKSVTTMAGGREVESPYNAYNEVLPRFAHNIAPYHKLREMVVTHTGLEPGAVIRFEYTLTSKPGYMPGVMDRILLADRSPVKQQEIVVRIPKGKTLKFDVQGSSRTMPAKTSDGDYEVYAWKFGEMPLIAVEDNQPSLWQFAPKLVFSSANEKELAAHMLPNDAVLEIDAETKAVAHNAVAGVDGDVPKALALQKFLKGKVAVMHGGLEHTGYRPQSAQQTWDRAAGSELDMAVLYTGMCRSVGIDAVPALVSDVRSTDEGETSLSSGGVPCLQQFTKGAALIPGADKGYLLFEASEAQHTVMPLDLRAAYFLPIGLPTDATDAGEMAVNKPYSENSIAVTSDWSITNDGDVSGRTAVEAAGAFAFEYNPEAMGSAVAKSLKSAGWGLTAKAEKSEALGRSHSKCEVKVESASGPDGSAFMHFALPAYGYTNERHVKTTSAPRQTPVDFKTAFAEEHLMTLHYPAGMKPVSLPEKVEIQNSAGSIRSIFIDHGSDVEIIRSINVPDIVPVEHYDDLKALMNTWNDPARQEVVFVKK